ncbi:hypothetical protein FOMPIDRAFT_1047118 [Fomitopsis schrenkii]|uniref:Uncharacterized protein n=1 Tax=Fomitopsis schrenkii TaxID=2126942 RepID=S8EF24_FOMSC|nr:hypothetical protein FOMPIDRAFT_1047118 [Fomitopsis schrenkii]
MSTTELPHPVVQNDGQRKGLVYGFGRLMTELLLQNGETAVATLRKPEAIAELSSK